MIEADEQVPDECEMTAKVINDTAFNYNSDWSGPIMIRSNGRRVDLPFSDLIAFFVELIRDRAIEGIEEMPAIAVLDNFGHMLMNEDEEGEEEEE